MYPTPISEIQAKLLEIIVGKTGKDIEIDSVVRERLRVLAEAKSFKPLRDVSRHGASLREAGFAEAVEDNFFQCITIDWVALHHIRDAYVGLPEYRGRLRRAV